MARDMYGCDCGSMLSAEQRRALPISAALPRREKKNVNDEERLAVQARIGKHTSSLHVSETPI
jgi:hypothetical protein